jgi:hypothetical protein
MLCAVEPNRDLSAVGSEGGGARHLAGFTLVLDAGATLGGYTETLADVFERSAHVGLSASPAVPARPQNPLSVATGFGCIGGMRLKNDFFGGCRKYVTCTRHAMHLSPMQRTAGFAQHQNSDASLDVRIMFYDLKFFSVSGDTPLATFTSSASPSGVMARRMARS